MKNLFKSPKRLTFLGLMLAITIILDMTPLGMIPLGAISATTIHIPTIITGIVLGPVAGLLMGIAMGVVGWIHALTRPVTILDPFFMNPLISVLPRAFIGLAAYFAYIGITKLIKKLIKKQPLQNTVGTFVGGMAGSITNTVLVFLMLYLIYAKELVEKAGMSFGVIIVSVVATNAIAEAIISGIITMPVVLAYFRYSKTTNK